MPSFDVVSELDAHEVTNAVDQANRELQTRFDFKNSKSKIERQEAVLSLLKADWAYLNQPAHIAPIILRHQEALGLGVTSQEQIGGMDNLPMRPAIGDRSASWPGGTAASIADAATGAACIAPSTW